MLAWEDRKAFIYICANDEAAQMKAQQMLIDKGYLKRFATYYRLCKVL